MRWVRRPWFALLESNTTGSGRQFCAAARIRGMRPVVLAADPARYPYLAQGDVDVRILDTSDAAAVRAACRMLADDGLSGVTSSSEYFAAGAAVAASELDLPAPDAAAITRCRHKDQQRAVLASAGVPGPAFRVTTDGAAAVSAAGQIGWPVVVKPIAGSGSVGVRRCGDPDEVQKWVRELHQRGNDRVLVEGYLDGPEFSVEILDGAVVGVVAKHLGAAPYFVEIGHDFPAPLDEPDRAALERAAVRAVRALGLCWGAAHVELRMTAVGPMIVEVNPRLAGGMIPTLLALSAGIDLVDAVVARASGQRFSPMSLHHGHAAIRFLVAGSSGTVTAASGPAAARALPLVCRAVLTVARGDTVEITHSFRDRLGYVIATGESTSAAVNRAVEALSRFTVTVSPPFTSVAQPAQQDLLPVSCNNIAGLRSSLLSSPHAGETLRFRVRGPRQLDEVAVRYGLSPDIQETVRLLSLVFPFRVNEYVLSELIDWRCVPDDPIFQLVFPQRGMLTVEDERNLRDLSRRSDSKRALDTAVRNIHARLNPHPAGQQKLNVPSLEGTDMRGMQHKYRHTVLYFPGPGQTCHAYCTYCFRWAQLIGDVNLRFATPGPGQLIDCLRAHTEVSDVLVTGGDPMVMSTQRLRRHLEPLMDVDTVRTIRIGTKSVAYWPHRFVTDPDADDALRLFEQVVASGRTLAVMAHYSHPRELETDLARRAAVRIRGTGALIYCQAPLIAYVNDNAHTWAALWRAELAASAIPYYFFVARDTGPRDYFKVPLARAVDIFREAYQELPGLARTVRGPVMSTTPGKVVIDGVEETPQGRFFQLRFLQARNPLLVGRPFRARYSESACWLDELELDSTVAADLAAAVNGTPAQP